MNINSLLVIILLIIVVLILFIFIFTFVVLSKLDVNENNEIPPGEQHINTLISASQPGHFPESSYLPAGKTLSSKDGSTFLSQGVNGSLSLIYKNANIWNNKIDGDYPKSITAITATGDLITYKDMQSAIKGEGILWSSSNNLKSLAPLPIGIYKLEVKTGYFEVTHSGVCEYYAPGISKVQCNNFLN
jgi:uncharacterized protein YneF (UPF0154 family)